MNEHLDQDLSELLIRCHQLKQKAKEQLEQKKSLPMWLTELLQNNPQKDNKSEGDNK